MYYTLCDDHFPGLTVDEMLARLSSNELVEWIAYLSIREEARKKARDEAEQRARGR